MIAWCFLPLPLFQVEVIFAVEFELKCTGEGERTLNSNTFTVEMVEHVRMSTFSRTPSSGLSNAKVERPPFWDGRTSQSNSVRVSWLLDDKKTSVQSKAQIFEPSTTSVEHPDCETVDTLVEHFCSVEHRFVIGRTPTLRDWDHRSLLKHLFSVCQIQILLAGRLFQELVEVACRTGQPHLR